SRWTPASARSSLYESFSAASTVSVLFGSTPFQKCATYPRSSYFDGLMKYTRTVRHTRATASGGRVVGTGAMRGAPDDARRARRTPSQQTRSRMPPSPAAVATTMGDASVGSRCVEGAASLLAKPQKRRNWLRPRQPRAARRRRPPSTTGVTYAALDG